jgi:hypothetical protein
VALWFLGCAKLIRIAAATLVWPPSSRRVLAQMSLADGVNV